MPNGVETLILPVASELLRNAAVAAVKFFRERGRTDENAREEAKQKLLTTKSCVETVAEDLVGTTLPQDGKDELLTLVQDAVTQLPIAEGLAIVTIARYCEIPAYRVQQTDGWMVEPSLLRTAMSHAWTENQFERCLMRLGYVIQKGQQLGVQLGGGVVNPWSDLTAKSTSDPAHRISVDVVCSPDPNDHLVASLLYDMETASVLQQGDWFFLATHSLFNPFVKGIIDRANRRVQYAIACVQAPQLKSMIQAHNDPIALRNLLRDLAGT